VTSITQAEMQAGDLVVWQTHMGIWLGNGQMISALDTNDGVKVTSLADGSPTGEILFPKRLKAAS
jgi:cell wall-associated NlpC family hydrolase